MAMNLIGLTNVKIALSVQDLIRCRCHCKPENGSSEKCTCIKTEIKNTYCRTVQVQRQLQKRLSLIYEEAYCSKLYKVSYN